MKILIIGANSYVGARIYFELIKKYDVVGTYHLNKLSDKFLQLDVTQENECNKIILNQKPDIIIHVANHADSSWCAENKEEAVKLNQTATNYIVEAANSIGSKIIYISSVSAFDGDIYGNTKLESEKIIKQTKAGYLILEPALILGFSPNTTKNRTFNVFLKNLDDKSTGIYNSYKKYLITYLGQICDTIDECITKNIWNKTMVIANKEIKTKYEIAKDLLTPFGIKVEADDSITQVASRIGGLDLINESEINTYTYSEIIEKLKEEIINRDKFIL